MEKRTNKLFTVTVAKFANMAVEADSPQEAMEIAKKYMDEYITDEDFEDSDIDVIGADSYPSKIEELYLDDNENVYTDGEVLKARDYVKQLRQK